MVVRGHLGDTWKTSVMQDPLLSDRVVRWMEKERKEEYVPGRWAEYNELLSQTRRIGAAGVR